MIICANCSTNQAETLLQQVAQRVSQLDDRAQRQEVSGYTQILAGLKYKKDLIQQLFQEDMMRDSVIYQDILEKGRQVGQQEGRQEGRQEGERSLVFRLLTRQVGPVSESLQARVNLLALAELERLGEALLEFQTIADLEAWFQALES